MADLYPNEVTYFAIAVRDQTTGEPVIEARGASGYVVPRGTKPEDAETAAVELLDPNRLPLAQPLTITAYGYYPTFKDPAGISDDGVIRRLDFIIRDNVQPIDSPEGLEQSARVSRVAAVNAEMTALEVKALAESGAFKGDTATLARGVLTDETDLNTLNTPADVGYYHLSSSSTYANKPGRVPGAALLEVVTGSGDTVVQRVTAIGSTATEVRALASAGSGSWSAWSTRATWTEVTDGDAATLASAKTYTDSQFSAQRMTRGVLANNTDLNALHTSAEVGFYHLSSALTYPNKPGRVAGAGLLEVTTGSGDTVIQRVTAIGGTATEVRSLASSGSGSWSGWSTRASRTEVTEALTAARKIHVGPTLVTTGLPTAAEYVWFKTDGDGNTLDILTGKV